MVVATGLVGAVAAPVVTVATSHLDRRVVLVSLTVLLVVADGLAAVAPSFAVLLAARMPLGVGIGGSWAIGAGIAGRLVAAPPATRARRAPPAASNARNRQADRPRKRSICALARALRAG